MSGSTGTSTRSISGVGATGRFADRCHVGFCGGRFHHDHGDGRGGLTLEHVGEGVLTHPCVLRGVGEGSVAVGNCSVLRVGEGLDRQGIAVGVAVIGQDVDFDRNVCLRRHGVVDGDGRIGDADHRDRRRDELTPSVRGRRRIGKGVFAVEIGSREVGERAVAAQLEGEGMLRARLEDCVCGSLVVGKHAGQLFGANLDRSVLCDGRRQRRLLDHHAGIAVIHRYDGRLAGSVRIDPDVRVPFGIPRRNHVGEDEAFIIDEPQILSRFESAAVVDPRVVEPHGNRRIPSQTAELDLPAGRPAGERPVGAHDQRLVF